jgi:F-type H+-transporting ATPase subunit epsilon
MATTLQLDIITPDEHVYSGEITEITVPGMDGSFQVLYNHAPIISTLAEGPIVIKSADGVRNFTANGGVIEVLNNKVIVLVERLTRTEQN